MFNYTKIKYFVLAAFTSISLNSFADPTTYTECLKNVYVIAINVPYTSNVVTPDNTWGVYYSETPDGKDMKKLFAQSQLTTIEGKQEIQLLEDARLLSEPVTFYSAGIDCLIGYFGAVTISGTASP